MGSFFASLEEREKPELKGLPVVVGSDHKGGAGWERCEHMLLWGKKIWNSAMPISQAYKLCPDTVLLPGNMKLYVGFPAGVMEILKGFAEKFQ